MTVDAPTVRYESELPRAAELVVVGGGLIGAATAFFAAEAGLRTLVVERRPRLATLTTPVSTGAFRLQFDNSDEIELVRESIDLFEAFPERTALAGWDLGLRRQGYLFASLTDDTQGRARRLVERQHAWGVTDVELLTGDEARYRFPYLSANVRSARFRAADGWLDPVALAVGLATAASQAAPGASFVTATEVIEVRPAGSGVSLATNRGRIDAGAVVLAAGPFLGELAARSGIALDIRPTRRQKLIFPVLPDAPPGAPMTIDEETAAHWRPALEGAICLWTEAVMPASRPLDDVPTSAAWAFGLLDPSSDHALERVAPFWRRVWDRGAGGWLLQAGQYEYTPDRRPYLGPTGIPGIHVNGGYSGHGIMAGPAGSRRVVDLLLGRLDPSANPFRTDRPMTQRELDIL